MEDTKTTECIKIYIAGPISGTYLSKTRRIFQSTKESILLAAEMLGLDIEVFNPFELDHSHDKKWESYMRVCIGELVNCHAVFFLPGYQDSKGCQLERHIAMKLNLRISESFPGSKIEDFDNVNSFKFQYFLLCLSKMYNPRFNPPFKTNHQ